MAEPTDPPARRPRRTVWVVGAVLWAGVFGALAFLLLRGDHSEPDAPPLVAQPAGEAGVRLMPEGSGPPPALTFDPGGLPDFALTERRGEPVTKADLLGETYIVGFVFTRCATVCPKVSEAMRDLRKQLDGTGVKLVTLTVDPEYDTPEILANYADFYGADDDPDWLWLTGEQRPIYELIRDGFKQPVHETTGEDRRPGFEIFHTANLMLVGPDGVVRGKYNSQVPPEMVRLRRDAVELTDAGAGK